MNVLAKEYGVTGAEAYMVHSEKIMVKLMALSMGMIQDYPEMTQRIPYILFVGTPVIYNPDIAWMDMTETFGIIKKGEIDVEIANRIFEMWLYNYY